MRRYALASLVGIVADEDDDGQAGRPRQQEQKPNRQQSRQQPVGETQQSQQQARQRPVNGTQKTPPPDECKVLIAQIVQMEKARFNAWKHKESARLSVSAERSARTRRRRSWLSRISR